MAEGEYKHGSTHVSGEFKYSICHIFKRFATWELAPVETIAEIPGLEESAKCSTSSSASSMAQDCLTRCCKSTVEVRQSQCETGRPSEAQSEQPRKETKQRDGLSTAASDGGRIDKIGKDI